MIFPNTYQGIVQDQQTLAAPPAVPTANTLVAPGSFGDQSIQVWGDTIDLTPQIINEMAQQGEQAYMASAANLMSIPYEYYPRQTYAGYTDPQLQAQAGALGYAQGGLTDMANAAMSGWYDQMAGAYNPLSGMSSSLQRPTSSALTSMMGGGNINQNVLAPTVGMNAATPQIGFSPEAQQIGYQVSTPGIDFQAQSPTIQNKVTAPNVNLPDQTLQQMMSGQVDMSAYDPIADAAIGRMTQAFNEDILPGLRSDEILSGQYGGSRGDLAQAKAADSLTENIGDMLANLYGGAYETAMSQRATGANLATQAGLEAGGLGLSAQELASRQATSQAQLEAGTQSLLGGLAAQEAGLGMEAQQLAGSLAAQQAGYGQQAQDLAAQLATSQAGLGMQTQQLGAQIGTENASLAMQAQNLAQQGRVAEADAILRSAGISSDMLTQAGAQGLEGLDLQRQALQIAPTVGSMGLMPTDVMANVGAQQQAMDQAAIDQAMAQYFYNQDAPYQSLLQYQGLTGQGHAPVAGSSYQQYSPQQPSSTAQALGGGMQGYSMGAMAGVNPWITAGLGALGGIL